MKCPNCKTEMEKGMCNGAYWRGEGLSTKMQEMFGEKTLGNVRITAYHCPKCGKIELATEVK